MSKINHTMLNITTGLFYNKMTFEAEFPGEIIVSGNFERNSWITSPAEFDEFGFCYAQQEFNQTIELTDLESMDQEDSNPEITEDMKKEIIQFIESQYV